MLARNNMFPKTSSFRGAFTYEIGHFFSKRPLNPPFSTKTLLNSNI